MQSSNHRPPEETSRARKKREAEEHRSAYAQLPAAIARVAELEAALLAGADLEAEAQELRASSAARDARVAELERQVGEEMAGLREELATACRVAGELDAEAKDLRTSLAARDARVAELEAQVAELERRAEEAVVASEPLPTGPEWQAETEREAEVDSSSRKKSKSSPKGGGEG